MPTRLIREGILTSDRVDRLDAAEEVFYRRLMSKVDDHGLFDGRTSVLRASLFPLRLDRVREADISRWLAACQKAGLIVLYEAEGKQLLCLLKTGWEKRSKPKYPLPPENICKQLETPVSLVVDVVGVVVEDGVKPLASSDKSLSAGNSAKSNEGAVNGDAVIYIPLVGDSEWGVSKAFAAELAGLYPAVDIPQTLREIRGWNLANPTKRKTAKGVARHINQWCSKEQNRG